MFAGCGGQHVTVIGPGPGPGPPNVNGGGKPGQPTAIYGQPVHGNTPRALVMLIHGGGWSGLSPSALKATEATAGIFQAFGFETMTVDYRAGARGVADVEQFYRDARKRVGPGLPICAFGVSAGAHIAMMLAVKFPDLACVVGLAGPTNLAVLKTQQGGSAGYKIAEHAFGTGRLAQYSPALLASSIKAKLLLVYAQNDPLVPVSQGHEMARADPSAKVIVLPPGSAPFVHTGVGAPVSSTGVDPIAKQQASQEELKFLVAST